MGRHFSSAKASKFTSAMALDSVAHTENPARMMSNISAATISLARRDFYAMIALEV